MHHRPFGGPRRDPSFPGAPPLPIPIIQILRQAMSMNDRVETLLGGRRERLARTLGRPLTPPTPAEGVGPLPEENRKHLIQDGEDLYWNELEWEHLTAEEAAEGGPLAALVFAGLLAYVRGLLLEEVMPDALAPAEPRPEVVRALLRFLAARVLELEEALSSGDPEDPTRLSLELAVTDHVVDLVLYEFHDLSPEEREKAETGRPGPRHDPAALEGRTGAASSGD